MPIFSYIAKNVGGQSKEGMVDARSQDVAISLLKAQGLFVINLEEKRDNIGDVLLNFRGVPTSDIVMFTRQFSTMISAGLPISRALEVLGAQMANKSFRRVIFDVLRAVEGGSSLSQAMSKYPDVFSSTYQALIRAGESSGKMDEILRRLAVSMESDNELNGKFKAAMVYPVIILIAMAGVFILLMVLVIPKLAEMYKNMNVELPLVTRGMIAVSDFFVNRWYFVLLIAACIFVGIRLFTSSSQGKYILTELSFEFPVFGKINRFKEQSQFTRTLSLLISAAVPIVEALNIVSTVVNSNAYKVAAVAAARQVEKGNSLSSFFKNNVIFPPLIGQMAGVGEETGKMDEVLDRVAGYYDLEVDNLIKGLTAALEPLILVMLGVMVGFMIVSIITPIYKITTSL